MTFSSKFLKGVNLQHIPSAFLLILDSDIKLFVILNTLHSLPSWTFSTLIRPEEINHTLIKRFQDSSGTAIHQNYSSQRWWASKSGFFYIHVNYSCYPLGAVFPSQIVLNCKKTYEIAQYNFGAKFLFENRNAKNGNIHSDVIGQWETLTSTTVKVFLFNQQNVLNHSVIVTFMRYSQWLFLKFSQQWVFWRKQSV